MASEQLKTVLELVGSADLGTLTLQERRALMGSAGAPPSEGTQVDPVGGTPAWQVVISGDSSGGGLALAALVALRDAGDPLPGAAVVISPWTDLDLGGESLRSRAAVDVMLTPDGAREAADWYLAGQDARHPYASPLYADLRGLPPVLIQAGDAEILRDDSLRFAAAAQAAGVDVTLEIWAEMPHVWHAFAGLLPEADEAVERIGSWLREDRATR